MITSGQFRNDFTEFGDNASYPDALVNYYLTVAYAMLNTSRWGQSTTGPFAAWLNTATYLSGDIIAYNNVLYQSQQNDNTGNIPSSSIPVWWQVYNPQLSQLDVGAELFVAHNCALRKYAQNTAAAGGVPGLQKGVISSESADGGSVSYDTSAGIVEGEAHWNLTFYGVQFIYMVRMVGAGPMQIGAGPGLFSNAIEAWAGPQVYPPWEWQSC